MEKTLWSQWNIHLQFIAPMEKAWFYERLFYQVVIVKAKDKKRLQEVDKSNVTSSFREI